MSEFRFNDHRVCKAQRLRLDGGALAGAYEIAMTVAFSIDPWDANKRGALQLVLGDGFVELRLLRGSIKLGRVRPWPDSVVVRFSHASESEVRFTLELDAHRLQAIEQLRDGQDLKLLLNLYATPYLKGLRQEVSMYTPVEFDVPAREWTGLLGKLGFRDFVHIEVPIPRGDDGPTEAIAALRKALEAQQRGGAGHAEAVTHCRAALEALKQAGFGGQNSQELNSMINKARDTSLAERVAAVHAALRIYFSAAPHAGQGADDLGRLDSGFAIAATAALIKLLPTRLGES